MPKRQREGRFLRAEALGASFAPEVAGARYRPTQRAPGLAQVAGAVETSEDGGYSAEYPGGR